MDRWYDNINKKEHYKLKKCSSSVFSLFYVVSGTAEQLWDWGKGGGRERNINDSIFEGAQDTFSY